LHPATRIIIPDKFTQTRIVIKGAIDHFNFLLLDMRRIIKAIEIFVSVVETVKGIWAMVLHFETSIAFILR